MYNMDLYKFKFIHTFVLVWVFYIRSGYSKQCNGRDQCACTYDSDSSVVELTSLGNKDLTPRFQDVSSSDGDKYSYNPCFPFTEGQCDQAAVCQISGISGTQSDIGGAHSAQFNYDEGSDTLTVTYTEGGGGMVQTTEVVLVCDPHACSPTLVADGSQGLGEFQLHLTTVCACPNGCDQHGPKNCSKSGGSSLSGGAIFLIIVFTLLCAYLIGGMLFMKFVRKAEGSDIIPNKAFWAGLPSSIKSGCLFVLSPCVSRGKSYNDI